MAHIPEIGAPAPAFTLPGDADAPIALADFKGRKLVLYFYPKADTSGCTREAMDFNALREAFAAAGTAIVGVSGDPVKALKKFKDKHGLAFPLASDEAKTTLEDYGVWKEKSMYGRTYMGTERTTLLIGRDGKVAQVWSKVKVPGHAAAVLKAAEALA